MHQIMLPAQDIKRILDRESMPAQKYGYHYSLPDIQEKQKHLKYFAEYVKSHNPYYTGGYSVEEYEEKEAHVRSPDGMSEYLLIGIKKNNGELMGMISFNRYIEATGKKPEHHYYFGLDIVFIRPEYQRYGYSVDLSHLARDVMAADFEYLKPKLNKINDILIPTFHTEVYSMEGVRFAETLSELMQTSLLETKVPYGHYTAEIGY